MYLIPLMFLALASGGVQRGSCHPSSTREVPNNYLRTLEEDFSGYFDSAKGKLEEIRRNGLAQGREMEVRILRAFIDLRSMTIPHCSEETNVKIEKMKEVLREGSSATGGPSISLNKIRGLKEIVSKMSKIHYEECFERQIEEISSLSENLFYLQGASDRMKVFEKFANFSLTTKPLESFKLQANHVLETPEYLEYLQTISNQLDSKAPKSPDGGPFSDSCGYLVDQLHGMLDYGIGLLEGAASFGLDLGSNNPNLQYYRNYALCIVSREYLMEADRRAERLAERGDERRRERGWFALTQPLRGFARALANTGLEQ